MLADSCDLPNTASFMLFKAIQAFETASHMLSVVQDHAWRNISCLAQPNSCELHCQQSRSEVNGGNNCQIRLVDKPLIDVLVTIPGQVLGPHTLICTAALEDPKLIPGAETPRCFVEQTSRRSCLDDSPLANGAMKDREKEDLDLPDAACKDLQPKDLLPSLADPRAFPVPHDAMAGTSAAFEGPAVGLKFETPLSMHGPDISHAVGNPDAPIIRLDGSSGMPHYSGLRQMLSCGLVS